MNKSVVKALIIEEYLSLPQMSEANEDRAWKQLCQDLKELERQ